MRRQQGRVGLMAAALVVLMAGAVRADVTTERSASILVFPKVVADGTRDTIIQITNTSNSMVHAHCFYVNGALTFPELPPGPLNPPLWTEVDFDIWLTKQQPTHWVVSTGRLDNPADQPCSNLADNFSCNGAGIDPGRVPPVVEDFTGELKCVEVDASGSPVSGNHLKGEATVITIQEDTCDGLCELRGTPCSTDADCPPFSDVAKYNGLGVIGNENNDGDGVLCLGGEPSEECPQGAEYNACPQFWILNHYGEGLEDPVAGEGSTVNTNVTIVPCTQNFETQNPETVTIFVETWNEYEQVFSSFAQVTCWGDLNLADIDPTFASGLATPYQQTRMRPTSATRSGFMVVGTEAHTTADGFVATASFNLHTEDVRPGPDIITIPAEQLD